MVGRRTGYGHSERGVLQTIPDRIGDDVAMTNIYPLVSTMSLFIYA